MLELLASISLFDRKWGRRDQRKPVQSLIRPLFLAQSRPSHNVCFDYIWIGLNFSAQHPYLVILRYSSRIPPSILKLSNIPPCHHDQISLSSKHIFIPHPANKISDWFLSPFLLLSHKLSNLRWILKGVNNLLHDYVLIFLGPHDSVYVLIRSIYFIVNAWAFV